MTVLHIDGLPCLARQRIPCLPCWGVVSFALQEPIFLTSLKIISEKYFHGTLARQRGGGSGAIGSDVRAYRQQEEKIRVGDPGLVAETHFAEGWLEGDQSCILRTGPGTLSSRPGRHTYGQRKCAVLPIVCGKTTIKAGSLPPFRCRLSCHASCRDVVLSRKRKAETPPPTWSPGLVEQSS